MIESEPLTIADKHLILQTFVTESLWQPEGQNTEVAYDTAVWDDQEVPIIGRRYRNCGGTALKVICYRPGQP